MGNCKSLEASSHTKHVLCAHINFFSFREPNSVGALHRRTYMTIWDIRDVLFFNYKSCMDIPNHQTGYISKYYSDPQLEFPHVPPSIAIIVVEIGNV